MKGFTLLEVIIAVTVITVGMGGVMALASFSLSAIPVSRQELVASYLAQEGIEVVRNIRDKNFLRDISWLSGIPSGNSGVQYDSQDLTFPPYDPNNYLRLDATSGYYNYISGNPTPFKRNMGITYGAIDAEGNVYEIKIKSEVTWSERGRNYSVVTEEWLYNWK